MKDSLPIRNAGISAEAMADIEGEIANALDFINDRPPPDRFIAISDFAGPEATPAGSRMAKEITRHAEDTASFIENSADELMNLATSYRAESRAFADAIRKAGKVEAERAIDFTTRMHKAGIKIEEARAHFGITGGENAEEHKG